MVDATQSRPRSGFTVVELLIALVLLSVGLLALAGTSGHIVRQMGASARLSLAARVASARLESLRAGGCPPAASGAATTGAVGELWTVREASSPRARTLADTVFWKTPSGERSASIATLIVCPP